MFDVSTAQRRRHHERIGDPMTTAAAIDRVVHHAVVLEFTGPSVRAEAAEQRAALAKRDASASERP